MNSNNVWLADATKEHKKMKEHGLRRIDTFGSFGR